MRACLVLSTKARWKDRAERCVNWAVHNSLQAPCKVKGWVSLYTLDVGGAARRQASRASALWGESDKGASLLRFQNTNQPQSKPAVKVAKRTDRNCSARNQFNPPPPKKRQTAPTF